MQTNLDHLGTAKAVQRSPSQAAALINPVSFIKPSFCERRKIGMSS